MFLTEASQTKYVWHQARFVLCVGGGVGGGGGEIRLHIRTVYSEPSLSDTIACINEYQNNKWRYPGNTIITKHNLPEAPKEEIRKNNKNKKKKKKKKHRLSHQNTKKRCNRGTALGRSVGKRLCGLNQFYSRETSPFMQL